jgi:hypothetical protein
MHACPRCGEDCECPYGVTECAEYCVCLECDDEPCSCDPADDEGEWDEDGGETHYSED